ncbi:MAG TPA: ThuA domain-containing protein [Candidatus Scatomonas merdavium]|nr:ThuA domain-containing protein [Candidatus Scatomonas merdavium]
MIRLTIWYENFQENGIADERFLRKDFPQDQLENYSAYLERCAASIQKIYPGGLGKFLESIFRPFDDIQTRLLTLDMPGFGLTDEILQNTDVLIWWSHSVHHAVPDELAQKIQQQVLSGMGFIALHSSHLCKPLKLLLGTSCTLRWRNDDFERVWTTAPTHPIARGIPASFELEQEEMFGEFFDIPKPDDVIFTGWFRGGEVFRSGCTWTRGYGRIFFFQPGHETNPSFHNPYVQQILVNAVRWAAPETARQTLACTHDEAAPESRLTFEKL